MKRTKPRNQNEQQKKLSPTVPVSIYTSGRIDESKLPTVYTFFKGNETAKEFKLKIEDLKEKYLAWLKKQEVDWILYYGHQTVVAFVTRPDGLNSSIDALDCLKLEMALTATRHTLYPDQSKKVKSKRRRTK